MMDERNLDRLAEIPDPFADAAVPPEPRVVAHRTDSSPTRSRVRAQRVGALAGAVICDAAWVAFVERRPDLALVPYAWLALGLGIPVAAAVLALSAVTSRGALGLGEPKGRVMTLAIASPVLFASATAIAAAPTAPDPLFWRHAVGCMSVTLVLVVGPLAMGLWAFRRAFVVESVWRTAALGVACGALAAATMSLVCPVRSASHVILGHGAILLIGAAVGALLGRRLCRA
jgi:hypothetical protein